MIVLLCRLCTWTHLPTILAPTAFFHSFSSEGKNSLNLNCIFVWIERLWRDLWLAVTRIYCDVLHDLEGGFLSIDNVAHLFCVHYVFLPRLQEDLDTFPYDQNNHALRTEGNMTPTQLWALGHAHHPNPRPQDNEVHVSPLWHRCS